MKSITTATVLILAAICPAIAQDRGPISQKEVLTQPIMPAPEGGDIILKSGESVRVYFKHPFKTVNLGDESSVKAVPESDHILYFTGIAPGRSTVTVEGTDGTETRLGLVTVVRDPHLVKIYIPPRVNRVSGENSQDSPGVAGFISVQCNEVGCEDIPKRD